MTPTPDADWPALTLPAAEAELVARHYRAAEVILEYGSGGSTALAASLPGKLVFSVESDRDWARRLQTVLDARDYPSRPILHHADIGPTGQWGRPLDEQAWRRFAGYATSIWQAPFFRDPDVVLIDGRLRLGCLAAVMLQARRPVVVLFDDYTTRPRYGHLNRLAAPDLIVGRMARFQILPGMVPPERMPEAIALFSEMSVQGMSAETAYGVGAKPAGSGGATPSRPVSPSTHTPPALITTADSGPP